MKLYHPALDVTIDRNERQAAVLADRGWHRVDDETADEIEPDPEPQDDEE